MGDKMEDIKKYSVVINLDCSGVYEDFNDPEGLMDSVFKHNEPTIITPNGKMIVGGHYRSDFSNNNARKAAKTINGIFIPGHDEAIDVSDFINGVKLLSPNLKGGLKGGFEKEGCFDQLLYASSLMTEIKPIMEKRDYLLQGYISDGDIRASFNDNKNPYVVKCSLLLNQNFGLGMPEICGYQFRTEFPTKNYDPQRNIESEILAVQKYVDELDNGFSVKFRESSPECILEFKDPYPNFTANSRLYGSGEDGFKQLSDPKESLKSFETIATQISTYFSNMHKEYTNCQENMINSMVETIKNPDVQRNNLVDKLLD
jgi:hypothetical protein